MVGFYCLDFAINAVQACCRSLIMDIPPTDQQEVCNAWSGWMNNLGSVVGFFTGNLDLVKYASPWLGNTQIKILANVAMISFVATLGIACTSVKEIQYQPTEEEKKRYHVSHIFFFFLDSIFDVLLNTLFVPATKRGTRESEVTNTLTTMVS